MRVIGSMEPEICTKMLRNLGEKCRAKFPATIPGYSMAKITHLNDAFSEVFEWKANPVVGQSLQHFKSEERRKKGQAKKNKKKNKSLKM